MHLVGVVWCGVAHFGVCGCVDLCFAVGLAINLRFGFVTCWFCFCYAFVLLGLCVIVVMMRRLVVVLRLLDYCCMTVFDLCGLVCYC